MGPFRNPLSVAWATFVAQLVKNPPAMQETAVGKMPWRRDRLPTPVFLGSPGGSDSKESAFNVGDLESIPGLGRSPEGRAWQPTPVFLPGESPVDRGAWQATVHGVAESEWLSTGQHSLLSTLRVQATDFARFFYPVYPSAFEIFQPIPTFVIYSISLN